jgi:hypothetical protein
MTQKGYNGAGVYLFRTRRPGLLGRIPAPVSAAIVAVAALMIWHYIAWWLMPVALLLSSRHNAYVGLSEHVRFRKGVHLKGSMKYNALPKPWTDLAPSWYFVPLLLPWGWLLQTVETLGISLLWPVYNHQKNLWNPRRISLKAAKRQRGSRDFAGWSFNFTAGHATLWVALIGVCLTKGWVPW